MIDVSKARDFYQLRLLLSEFFIGIIDEVMRILGVGLQELLFNGL